MRKFFIKMCIIQSMTILLTSCALGGTINVNNKDNADTKAKEDWKYIYGISLDTSIKKVTIDTALEEVKNDKGILVISSPDCPYCQIALPIIDELSKEYPKEKIYYVDAQTINQKKRIELNEFIGNTLIVNHDKSISLLVPDVYAIKKGNVLVNQRQNLNDMKELKNKYKYMFEQLY